MADEAGNNARDTEGGNSPQGDLVSDGPGRGTSARSGEAPGEYHRDDLTDYTDFNGEAPTGDDPGPDSSAPVTADIANGGPDNDAEMVFLSEAPPPSREIQQMKPIHALMVMHKALGWTNRKIAKEVGYSESWVSEITRQRWFLDKLEEVLNGGIRVAFGKAMSQLSIPAAATVEHILNNPMAKDNDRLRAAQIIIEQAYGKPNQKVEVRHEAPDAVRELDDLDAQLAEIRGQLADMESGKSGGGHRADLSDGESFSKE